MSIGTPVLIATQTGSGITANTTAFTEDCNTGDVLIYVYAIGNSRRISSATPSTGSLSSQTSTAAVTTNNHTIGIGYWIVTSPISSGSTLSVTWTAGFGHYLQIWKVAGLNTASVADVTSALTVNTSTGTSGIGTTTAALTNNYELVMIATEILSGESDTFTAAPAPWATQTITQSGMGKLATAWQIVNNGAGQTYSISQSNSVSRQWQSIYTTFNAALTAGAINMPLMGVG